MPQDFRHLSREELLEVQKDNEQWKAEALQDPNHKQADVDYWDDVLARIQAALNGMKG